MVSFLPPLPKEQKRPRKRRLVALPWESSDRRAIRIAIVATILVHIGGYFLLPEHLDTGLEGHYSPEQRSDASRNFSIELAPDEFVIPEKKPPTQFVEANPDVPDNEPDNTDNFAAQNQQAAQEKAPKETGGDRPEMEGRTDIQTNQIVEGNLQPTMPLVPLPPPPAPQVKAEQTSPSAPTKERNPLPGIEKYTGENEHAYGSNIAKVAPHPEDLKEKVEGLPDAPEDRGTPGVRARVAETIVPRERPKLAKRARPAIFSENRLGTSNIGPAAVDARWSNYGEYLQRMIEAVQIQWEKLIIESRTYPERGSVVKVKFILNAKGDITRIVSVEGGMAGQQAERTCVSGITAPAPYGAWSDDMVTILGEEQEMTFSFYFQ